MSDDLYTKDDVRWDKEADDVRHKALDDVRSLSSKWEGTVATILGLFSTVAIVTGPASFDKLTYTWGPVDCFSAYRCGRDCCFRGRLSRGAGVTGPRSEATKQFGRRHSSS